MKSTKVLLLTLSLAISSMASAENGSDRVFERMMKSRDVAMEASRKADKTLPAQQIAQEKEHSDTSHC